MYLFAYKVKITQKIIDSIGIVNYENYAQNIDKTNILRKADLLGENIVEVKFEIPDKYIQIDKEKEIFNNCKKIIISRGNKEIKYWNKEIDKIKKYTKEKAIKELLKALKIEEKIRVITKFISSLTDKKKKKSIF